MNYFEKNKKNIIIGVIATLLIAALVALWLQKKVIHSSDDIVGVVYPASIKVGDTLNFKDKTQFANLKKWDFGDGNTSNQSNGIHFYNKPGYYNVTLIIDNKYSKSFPILVSARDISPEDPEVITKIDADSQAHAFENVQFRAISDATQFSWKFGESGRIDSKEKNPTHSYQKEGSYVVTLYTDKSPDPIYHNIYIKKAFSEIDDPMLKVDDSFEKMDNDFKYRLQQIANGNDFNTNYNYLLTKYLCSNESAIVNVTDSKVNNFYLYCAGLQFDKNRVIQTVKLSFNQDQTCVTKVDINQSK